MISPVSIRLSVNRITQKLLIKILNEILLNSCERVAHYNPGTERSDCE